MNLLQIAATAAGLGFLAGMRLYLTVLTLGLAVRFGWMKFLPQFHGLDVLGDWRILSLAGVAAVIEFAADKIPWVDSFWDGLHTFIRPIGAIAMTAGLVGDQDPAMAWMIALLTGGAAIASHSTKAATRLAANHSPEPFSNIALSIAGDIAVPAGVWFTTQYPYIAGVLFLIFAVAFAVIAPVVFRMLRSELAVIGALFMGSGEVTRAVAVEGVRGLKNSVGTLTMGADGLTFEAKRWMRVRTHRIALKDITGWTLEEGWLVDRLNFSANGVSYRFDLLKNGRRLAAPGANLSIA